VGEIMRIAFNLLDCGLGNNGGSQTIIRMAYQLFLLGHDVNILINQPNRFTWFDIPKDLIFEIKDEIPQYDIMIATGCSTVKSILAYNKLPMDKKFYWIRAIETWAMPLYELIVGYGSGLHLIVNSEWQRRFIYSKTGIIADIVYSGLPLTEIRDNLFGISKLKSFFDFSGKLIIGALASKKDRKRFKDIIDICTKLSNENLIDRLVLIGNEDFEKIKSVLNLDKIDKFKIEYYKQPPMTEKIMAMLNCDIWLSTTVNEGLHIPPLEAALCGCFLISRDKEESGLSDYSIDNYTSFNYLNNNDAVRQIKRFNKLTKEDKIQFNNRLYDIIRYKIGSVESNANKMLKVFNNEL
jgi:hypothetical protein